MRENKSGKYVKYAIGEILLVVIGILIALQINNWNENRKQKATTKEYIENIKVDITEDLVVLEDILKYANERKAEISEFEDYLLQSNDPLSKKLQSAIDLGIGFYRYYPVNQTYIDMQSSGSSKLLNERQRSALSNLLNQQVRTQKTNTTFIEWSIAELNNRNKYIDRKELLSKVTGVPPTEEELRLAMRHQLNFFDINNDMSETLIRFVDEMKAQSEVVLSTLEE